MSHVIVIGGGFAGLSAATALAEAGVKVTVLEGRQVLGGRAYSFVDPKTGDSVDNGQHLFMGCYRETLKFLERIQCLHHLDFQSALSVGFIASGGKRTKIHCWPLPAPFHLYSGLLLLGSLSWGDRWRLRYVESALKKNVAASELDGLTVDEWLTRCHQSPRAKSHLWDLITIACLNEDPRVASALPFVTVLKQAFFEDPESSRLAMANVGLSELYVQESVRYLQARGADIRLKSPVQRLECDGYRATGVVLRDGAEIAADAVVSAVAPWALLKLMPSEWVDRHPYFQPIKKLTYAPIISIHLWFDRAIADDVFAGLLDTHIQWFFNRSYIHRDAKSKEGYVSLTISGAHDFVDWKENKILSLVMEEMRRLFPRVKEAHLLRSLVIKEAHATLSPKVNTETYRPEPQSPAGNVIVAGDWTRTGLPATIESACVSGHRAAQLVLKQGPLSAAPEPEVSHA